MRRSALAASLLLTGIPLLPAAMHGQTPQFTFTVPVQVSNLHEAVQTAAILCNLYTSAGQPPTLRLEGPINLMQPCAACPRNAFDGNVTVQGSLPEGSTVKPEQITLYDCNLTLNGSFPRQTTDTRTAIELQAQLGTLFTGMVQGSIP